MSSPPPPDVMRSFRDEMWHQAAASNTEADERRRLRNEIEMKKLQLELASLTSRTAPGRRSIDTYENQIKVWFKRLPPEARKAPRTMEEFINLLDGRTPGMKAHAPDVARILRGRLGWVRKRIWKADGEGRRVWMPPG